MITRQPSTKRSQAERSALDGSESEFFLKRIAQWQDNGCLTKLIGAEEKICYTAPSARSEADRLIARFNSWMQTDQLIGEAFGRPTGRLARMPTNFLNAPARLVRLSEIAIKKDLDGAGLIS